MGWVVTDDRDQPAAMLGNFVQRFRLGSRRLHGATGFSLIVPPARKGASRGLIRAFLAQPELFARYTFNANARSAPLYKLFGFEPWPDATHDLKLSWIVDRLACAQGRALRHLLGRISAETAARLGERLLNPRLVRPQALRLPADIKPLRDLSDGSPYAAFWRALSQEERLLADRSPEVLRWRLADPDLTTPPVLLACAQEGRIVGVAQALMTKTSLIEPPCLDILDLIALQDAPDAVARLARCLVDNARGLGAAKVRLQTVNPALLRALGDLGVQARREGGWGHCHAIVDDPALATVWAPTPFDGDYGVCSRPAPLPRARRDRVWTTTPTGRVSKA